MTERYIVFDLEMPGQHEPRISAIGITVIENRKITDKLYYLVNPECRFDPYVVKLIGITPEMVKNEPPFPVIWEKIKDVMSSGVLVAHGAPGDLNTLCLCLNHYGIRWRDTVRYLCTCDIGLKSFPGLDGYSLNTMCEHIGFPLRHHYALSDSEGCARLLLDYIDKGIDVDSFLSDFDCCKCHRAHKKKKKPKKTLEQKIRKQLFSLKDEDEFLKTILLEPLLDPERVIGVRNEDQYALSRQLLDENKASEYIRFLPHLFHEENNIHALLLNERKRFSVLIELLDSFLPYVSNNQTCSLLMPRLFEKGQPELAGHLARWLCSSNRYTKLFALNVIQNYYIKAAYSDFLKGCLTPFTEERDDILRKKAGEILLELSFLEVPQKKRKRKRKKAENAGITSDNGEENNNTKKESTVNA